MLDLIEKPFDQISGSIQIRAEADRLVAVASWRGVGPSAPLGGKRPYPVRIIATIRTDTLVTSRTCAPFSAQLRRVRTQQRQSPGSGKPGLAGFGGLVLWQDRGNGPYAHYIAAPQCHRQPLVGGVGHTTISPSQRTTTQNARLVKAGARRIGRLKAVTAGTARASMLTHKLAKYLPWIGWRH